MRTTLARRQTNDRSQGSSSPSAAEQSLGAVKHSQQAHYRAQMPNTGALLSLHVETFGSKEFDSIWAFPSKIRFSFTATTQAVFIRLSTKHIKVHYYFVRERVQGGDVLSTHLGEGCNNVNLSGAINIPNSVNLSGSINIMQSNKFKRVIFCMEMPYSGLYLSNDPMYSTTNPS